MGLFDKKYCDICERKIGLLGGYQLSDGLLCSDCAARLSPFFSLSGSETLEQIRTQLSEREENRSKLESFRPDKCFGVGKKLYLDEKQGCFAVSESGNFAAENPDLFSLADLSGARLDIPETRRELFRQTPNGRMPYNPRRYTYSYDFYLVLSLNHPYVRELKLKLNGASMDGADHMGCQKQKEDGEAIVKYLRLAHLKEEQKQNRGPVLCPFCGATTTPDEKGCCEYCGSKLG